MYSIHTHNIHGVTAMHLNLPTQLEEYAQNQVNLGYYSSVSEFIRDAIRAKMEKQRLRKLETLKTAIAIGDDELERGEGIVFTDKLMDKIDKNAMDNSANNKTINNLNVLPE